MLTWYSPAAQTSFKPGWLCDLLLVRKTSCVSACTYRTEIHAGDFFSRFLDPQRN